MVPAAAVGLRGRRLPILPGMPDSEALGFTASAGIFFLVLVAGLEMKPNDLAETSRGAIEAVILGIVLESGLLARGDTGSPVVANLFSMLVLTAISNTVLARIILRRLCRGGAPRAQ